LQTFGFNQIPDVQSLQQQKLKHAQDYFSTRKQSQKPLFSIPTRKRPINLGSPPHYPTDFYRSNTAVNRTKSPLPFHPLSKGGNLLAIDTSAESRCLPLINEIFLVDPQTNQVHSIVRQLIPSGNQEVGDRAVRQLEQHLYSDHQHPDIELDDTIHTAFESDTVSVFQLI